MKTLMNTKVGESKLSDIFVVRDFICRVSGKNCRDHPHRLVGSSGIDLVHGAMSVAKSPYRLAPLEMQELSEQLRELQDQGSLDIVIFRKEHQCRLLRRGAWSSFEDHTSRSTSVHNGSKRFISPPLPLRNLEIMSQGGSHVYILRYSYFVSNCWICLRGEAALSKNFWLAASSTEILE
ncbi:hypothetical protein Tco_0908232 [Tanacetum coccineum]|uniref:Reverse transcriptase domain-containing protein n=1 Tax=Tanacetum coccineum TaxID=301880 RepID=A0ABQ5CNG5_9ASTR